MSSRAKRWVMSGSGSKRPDSTVAMSLRMRLAAPTERGHDAVVAQTGGERVLRHLKLAGVDAKARERAARPQAAKGVLERTLGSERLDRHIRAAPRQALHLGGDVDLSEVEDYVCLLYTSPSPRD